MNDTMGIMRYYVYGYFREDGTPYYIGKGCGGRAWQKHRYVNRPSQKDLARGLLRGLTEQEALDFECYLIDLIGRVRLGSGPLENITAGGQGTSGRLHTAEAKALMSINRRGKGPKRQTENWKKRKAESCRQPLAWTHDDFGTITCSAVELSTMFNKPNRHKLSMVKHGKRSHTKGWRLG